MPLRSPGVVQGAALCGVAVAAIAFSALPGAWAGPPTVLGLPLVPGARVVPDGADGLFTSPRGFRKTVEFYRKVLRSRGIAHRAVPVYGYHGTVVARFVSTQRGTPWSALHIYKNRGVTMIYIVPEPP